MRHLIAYDVSRDGSRQRLSHRLNACGDRIQRSVYLCDLRQEDLAALVSFIEGVIDPSTDTVHVIALDAATVASMILIGQASMTSAEPFWAVW